MLPPIYFQPNFEIEIIYSFVIIICSLMIYQGTKRLYKLSSYPGIKYFRQAFLFFAIAYFFRSIIKLLLMMFGVREMLEFPPRMFGVLTLFLFMYFSCMAIFYLFYSIMWKKESPHRIYLFHLLAFIISALVIISRKIQFLSIIILIIFTLYASYKISRGINKKQKLYLTYSLFVTFWILNVIDIIIPDFFVTIQLFIYLASTAIFLLVLYKVLKKTGSD